MKSGGPSDMLERSVLYGVTDLKDNDPIILDKVEMACRGGVDIIQLRSKVLCDKDMYAIGLQIRQVTQDYKKLFFVNDRLDLAFALQSDGIHVGQDDLAVNTIRKLSKQIGHPVLIGKSTHSLQQALETSAEDVDYIGFGPVFSTPTKPGYPAIGLDMIDQVKQRIQKPFVVIGGIDENNIQQLLAAGASKFAVVRALFNRKDTYEAARKLRTQIAECREKQKMHA